MSDQPLNRRDFLRTVGLGAAGLTLPALAAGREKQRPNVVVIIADDLAYADLGCYGSEIPTPHIDSLARRGSRFTQFYGCSVCCPSRAALLTGLYPHQTGVGWMVNNAADSRPPGPYQGYLNDNCATIAEVLKQSGYRTLMSGKWHVGESRPHWPVDRGFDRYFGVISGAVNYFDMTKRDYPNVVRQMALDGQPYQPPKDGFYLTDAIADHAVEFLDGEKEAASPFFLYMAFTAPHFPIQAPAADIARHRGRYRGGWDRLRAERYERMKTVGTVDGAAALSPRDAKVPAWPDAPDHDLEDLKMAIYAAQIEVMDRGVGRVLAKLKAMGQEENTIIFFTADHGACAAEECAKREAKFNRPPYLGGSESFAAYGRAWANVSNTPWRNFKASLGEGGISIPMIAAGPGVTAEPGGLRREVGHQIDFLPTILEMTGTKRPPRFRGRELPPLEGISLAPALRGEGGNSRGALHWEFEGSRAMRDGGWKLYAADGGPWELYDLSRDRSELRDLAREQPERVREMAARQAAWEKRCGVRPWREMKPLLRNL